MRYDLTSLEFQVVLVAFVCLSIVLCTAGIYLRSWELEFKIQELKDAPGIDPTTIRASADAARRTLS